MKIKQLIALLQQKDQESDVEFIVATKDRGQIVCMQLENQATAVVKALQLFNKGD